MDRTLMPIGVASISFTCFMSGASIERTWSGSFFFFVHCFQTGDQTFQYQGSLSGTGNSSDQGKPAFWNIHFRGFTVWIAEVERWILPKAKRSSAFVLSLTEIAVPERKGPILKPDPG